MLEIQGVSAFYGELRVLDDVTLRVGAGERVAIFGHNGAGKTTLLKCSIGQHGEMSGRIAFAGAPVIPGEAHLNARRGMGFVPQGHNVFRELSVERNLRVAGLLHGDRFLEEAFALFPVLRERRNQLAGSLSGGQQQMLAVGMALMTHPKVLLLDEPTTGLAPIIVQNMLKTLKAINARLGTAIVIVEQNIPATLGIVERAVVLKSGRIASDGPAAELSGHANLWDLF